MVTTVTNRKSQVADQSVLVPMTLSDSERLDARVNFYGGYRTFY